MSVLEGMHSESVACAVSTFFSCQWAGKMKGNGGMMPVAYLKSNNFDWERKFLSGSVQIICCIVMVI